MQEGMRLFPSPQVMLNEIEALDPKVSRSCDVADV